MALRMPGSSPTFVAMPTPLRDDVHDEPSGLWGQYSTQIVALVGIAVVGVGTVTYRILEDWSWVDSFYFSVITLTTVGYGDFAPTTDASKLFTVLYLVVGISLLGASLNEMGKRRRRRIELRRARRREA